MPAWMASALLALSRVGGAARGALVGTPGRALLTGTAVGQILPGVDSFGIPGVDLFPGGHRRRRRRKRALTASDRADIAFLTGILGKTAGKELAIVIATR